MFNIGSQELVVILFVVLMLFGAKRIPEVARSVGSGMREFRKAMRGIEDELRFDDDRRPGSRFEPRRSEPAGASTTGGTATLTAGTATPTAASGGEGGIPAPASGTAPAVAPHPDSAGEPVDGGSDKGSEERAS
jgi:sec-independent protein translocase protein TatA